MPFGRPFRPISLCVSFPGLKPCIRGGPADVVSGDKNVLGIHQLNGCSGDDGVRVLDDVAANDDVAVLFVIGDGRSVAILDHVPCNRMIGSCRSRVAGSVWPVEVDPRAGGAFYRLQGSGY